MSGPAGEPASRGPVERRRRACKTGLRGGAQSLRELAHLDEEVVLVASAGQTSEVRGR